MRWRPRPSLVGSPVFAIAVLVLLVNDHVLKAAWPGWVTGKLSDVAGVAMVAIALTALLGRRGPAFALTVVAFTLLKTVSVVAGWAAPVLGGTTRTDPSDVLAFAVLGPLWWWIGRVRDPAPTGLDAMWSAFVVRVVVVGLAVIATTATSCDDQGIWELDVTEDGRILAGGSGRESPDGGITWEPSREMITPRSVDELRRSCIGDTCYELRTRPAADGVRIVEIAPGGAERLVSTFVSDGGKRLDEYEQPTCRVPRFGSIAAVDRDDGHHVVVAMGALGVIHVGPDRVGEWIAVGTYGIQENDASDEPLGLRVRTPIDTR